MAFQKAAIVRKVHIIGENSKCSWIEAILITVSSFTANALHHNPFCSFPENLIIIVHSNVLKVEYVYERKKKTKQFLNHIHFQVKWVSLVPCQNLLLFILNKINLKIPNLFKNH